MSVFRLSRAHSISFFIIFLLSLIFDLFILVCRCIFCFLFAHVCIPFLLSSQYQISFLFIIFFIFSLWSAHSYLPSHSLPLYSYRSRPSCLLSIIFFHFISFIISLGSVTYYCLPSHLLLPIYSCLCSLFPGLVVGVSFNFLSSLVYNLLILVYRRIFSFLFTHVCIPSFLTS